MPILNMPDLKVIKILEANNAELRKKAFDIRQEVFVVEQQVSREDEFDQFEETSHHFVVLDANDDPIGAARWRKTYEGIKLERFVVKKSMRGNNIGSLLVKRIIEDIQSKLGKGQHLYLNAQIPAMLLYQKFGFKKIGDEFLECNIKHFKMILDT